MNYIRRQTRREQREQCAVSGPPHPGSGRPVHGLTGRIQTGSYVNQEGTKIYTTDVVTENVEFVESKGASAEDGGSQQRPTPVSDLGDGFMNIPDGVEDDGLPFN